mgnify:CR=1 FL=1
MTENSNIYESLGEKEIKEIMSRSMVLLIKVIKSSGKDLGREFTINPLGLISDSKYKNLMTRNKNDGITYFGNLPNNEKIDMERNIDAKILETDKEEDNSILNSQQDFKINYGKFFQISFNPQYRQYYIKDCGFGYGTFIKIQNEFIMKDNLAINIGNTYISTKIGMDDTNIINEGVPYNNSKIPSLPNIDLNSNLTLKIFSESGFVEPVR